VFLLAEVLASSALLGVILTLKATNIDCLRNFWRIVAAILLSMLCSAVVKIILQVFLHELIGDFGMFIGHIVCLSLSLYLVLGWLFQLGPEQRRHVTGIFIAVLVLWSLIKQLVLE
jgi:hypothetical protein